MAIFWQVVVTVVVTITFCQQKKGFRPTCQSKLHPYKKTTFLNSMRKHRITANYLFTLVCKHGKVSFSVEI